MKQQTICALPKTSRGFTLVELVIVVTIVLVLSALALPSFNQWYQNAAYRDTARNIMSELRQAKSQAIEKNVAQQVQFEAESYGSSDVGSAITNTTKLDLASQVTISPTINIQFTPMGIASTGTGTTATIYILDSSGKQRFSVQVEPTGRISVEGPL